MAAAANYAFANRQMITHWVRESIEKTLQTSAANLGLSLVYDVCHNIAKLEKHGVKRKRVYALRSQKGRHKGIRSQERRPPR